MEKKAVLAAFYLMATVQFVWCYLWLTRPYVNTVLYEQGLERMPFQGRVLMMFVMRWAHGSALLAWVARMLTRFHFWFPKPVTPEVLAQAAVDVGCLVLTGWMTARIYKASSLRQLLTPFVYPLLLAAWSATFILHTVQNFRLVYDLPSLTFFAVAMELLYFRRPWPWFAVLFCVATLNRETTLLLLPLFLLNKAVERGRLRWSRVLRLESLAQVLPLAAFWIVWQVFVHRVFAGNASEFYPRIDWNLKSFAAPLAWPQMLSADGYLLLFVIAQRRRIPDARLRAWLWLLPIWVVFMFVYGILIETRVFGELIPLIVCATALILEELLVARLRAWQGRPALAVVEAATDMREAA